MTVIGLTGGIASGKSTAAEVLRELGAAIIDADRLGHRSYEPGTRGFTKVVNAFGHDIVAKDGTIDRRILGGKVFGAPDQIERLNAIVWPEIRALIKDEVKQIRAQDAKAIIVLEAAVLLEAKWQDLCDEIWVILTPVKTAVERLRNRNGLSEDAAMARINAQMSNKERSDAADVKIENAGTEEQLRQKVEKAWETLTTRLGHKPNPPARKAAPEASETKAPAKAATKATKASSSKASASKAGTSKAASKPAKASARTAAAKPAAATKTAPKATAKAAPAKSSAVKPAAKKAPVTKGAEKAPASKVSTSKASTSKASTSNAGSSKASAAKPAAKAAKAPSTKAAASKAGAAKSAAKKSAAASKAKPAASKATAKPKAAAAEKPAASTRTVAKKAPAERVGSRTK